ncbi:MAG: LuxR family transcriptional regulator [Alphaproteobacteria bacterium]|nr:LuxR family transcriptional regulator [Alphaproteobacteria bacterium]
MHHVFQRFVERLNDSREPEAFQVAMAEAASAFELPCFAYLRMPRDNRALAALISTYPVGWTDHYLNVHYERLDPVIRVAHQRTEPFEWGLGADDFDLSKQQQTFFDEAAEFGIRCGFTIPIKDARGPVAAVTFASDVRRPEFQRSIQANARVLQLMAISLHAHARRKLYTDIDIKGVHLTARERECMHWAAQGKSRWETGQILKVSAWTVKFHLDNAKAKLGVRTVTQAIARLERAQRYMPLEVSRR